MTTAKTFAELFNDNGMTFTSRDGEEFSAAVARLDATVEYSERNGYDEETQRQSYTRGYVGSYISGDPIRYVFPDSSVIVTAGDGWDFEGSTPFSWTNE